MHHGSGPQNVQRSLQRSRSYTGGEGDEPAALAQSPGLSPVPHTVASPSAPQSPSYQKLVKSRSPVSAQNVNITLQNLGQVMAGNQQITLTSHPNQNPVSPGYQYSSQAVGQQRRFEHGSPSYIQVTSPLSQIQPQSPTQHSPVSMQALQNVQRTGTAAAGLNMCNQSPTRGFVDSNVLVRQLNLSPSSTGHFVYQDASGLTQITSSASGQLQLTASASSASVQRERRLSQPHSHTGGTIHHLGPQSPVASGAMQPLPSPSHITTSNLPPQISSIIQGLHGQQMTRSANYERTAVSLATVVGPPPFAMGSPPPPSSPSRTATSALCLASSNNCVTIMRKHSKRLEEIPPATPEIAQTRKQCWEHHVSETETLRETFKDYLVELFFLQHLQGNMMDFLAFRRKPCVPLMAYLKQNDLDLEEEEEEEQSEVINDEVKVVTGKDGQTGTPVAIATQLPPNVSAAFSTQQQQQFQQTHQGTPVAGTANTVEIEAFKRQQAFTLTDQSKRPRIEGGRHGMVFQHTSVTLGSPAVVSLQQLMPTVQGGMPPTPQTLQLGGQKQNQQQYDPSKGPPVKNAATLHTPPPQLPARLQASALSLASLPASLQLAQQQTEVLLQPQTQLHAQTQASNLAQVKLQPQAMGFPQSQTQLQVQLQQQVQASHHVPIDSGQACQRLIANAQPTSSMSQVTLPGTISSTAAHQNLTNRTSPAISKPMSPIAQPKLTNLTVTATPKTQTLLQSSAPGTQETSENQIHQRIAELRKEGLWSVRRLPRLQEAPRAKCHWDYLLEEMQWMATDFAQERKWKMGIAKKLARTVVRHHEEQKLNEEKAKKEQCAKLRRRAAVIAREVQHFWYNIEKVVEVKLQLYMEEQRRRALTVRKESSSRGQKRIEDCEETMEEQEAAEGIVDHQTELSDLAKEAEIPLEDLLQKYAGAYSETFAWPGAESLDKLEEEFHADLAHPEQDVTIDSLLSVDQYRGAERLNTGPSEGKRPRKDIAEVAGAAELLLPKGLARCTALVKSSTPLLLHGSLREYQQVGLDWLASLNRRKLNGILADETRLGKTVQIIAFLAHLACNEGIWGPHLVVVRTCKMLDWEMEFKRWCPGLKIMMYFGTRKERRGKRECWMEPNSFHVCITSYKLLLKDHQAFVKKRWKYLVLDEVQQLRNTTERHWEAFFNLKSQQRLLLIGTPLQNTLMELWTMMHFLMPGISRHYLDFPVKTGTDENQDYCHKLVIRMHRMIQPFILRRSKRDVEKQLPKKYEHILKCCLSKRQRNLYEDVMSQTSTREALRTGRFISVLNALIQLRKICNHPNLVSTRCVRSSFVCEQLHYSTASLVLKALEYDTWKNVDMSIFNLSGIENKRPRYESEVGVPLRKVTRKLIEEIYNSPDLPPRPKPVKMKVSKLFHPVQYGQKPDDRTVVMVSAHPQRTANTASSIATHHVSARGKPPGVAMSAAPGQGEVVSIGQLASIAGGQGRGTQTSQPVTLHFQGNKFTLSSSQLRQLTAGQHLQIQGNVLQIVSAPGQQIVRQQGQVVMQSPSHANAGNALHSASAALGNQHGIASSSIATSTPGKRCTVYDHLACIDSVEEKKRLTKERLDRIFVINERRSSVKPVYGTELLGICFMMGEYKLPKSKPTLHWWGWSGYVNCCSWRSTEPILRHPFTQSNALSFYSIQCVIPNVVVLPPRLYIFNPPPTYTHKTRLFNHNLKQELAPYHQHRPHIAATAVLQLSDPRLVQFDSGKLEALAVLLQKLRSEARRVLVFTQMVRMLDILESFLDYHRFVFVRIDGNTHLSQRQTLMKRFNTDKRIFCAILCSRSAAVGVNLVDADTVVVYDGDLNPTLDGQVQEWCDRIGNCKDIHIYRLVSGNSIEEKLLKNGTKNLIRDVALQGSNYSMAYLQQQTVRDLFEVTVFGDSALKVKTEEFVVLSQVPSLVNQISPKETKPFLELTPVEKYAMNYLELTQAFITPEEQRPPEVSKIKSYPAINLEYVNEGADGQNETMPIWTPPTPPQDDNDIYMDPVMCLMYETTAIAESKLPPVYVRKEHKRLKLDASAAGKKFKKARHGEAVSPPRSLFDRAAPCILKMRREAKDQKKNMFLKQQAPFAKPLPSFSKQTVDGGQDSPEWLISEDWALLQAVKQLLELPLSLAIISPAHTPNWDLVSDVVNSCSHIYRSPKQCRNRYENVIIPREEGKTKNSRPLRTSQIYAQDESAMHTQRFTSHFELVKLIAGKRSPPIKPMLGMNPFQKNPKNASVLAESGINYDKPLTPIQVASLRAERIAKEKKALAEQQRAQQLAQQQAQQNTQPAVQQQQPQQQAQPQAVVQTAAATVANTAVLVQTFLLDFSARILPGFYLADQYNYFSVHLHQFCIPATVSGNVIVNTATGIQQSTFQPINKRITQPVIPGTLTTAGGTAAQVVHGQQRTVPTSAATEVVAIATNQGVRAAITPVTAAVVSTSLSPAQSQTRSLVTQVTPGKVPSNSVQLTTGKSIAQAQIQLFRQQTPQVQVQQIQSQSQTPLKTMQKLQPVRYFTHKIYRQFTLFHQARVPTSQLQTQTQPASTTQVTLAKPSVVPVPAGVVPSGVTTLPVTVAGISVAIAQPQKGTPGKYHLHRRVKEFDEGATHVFLTCRLFQITGQPQQQQKVTYAPPTQLQQGLKPQFLSVAQPQKQSGSQPMQTQIQVKYVAKGPTLPQGTTGQQVQVIPTTATAQVVQQQLIQHQVVTAASPQIQTPPPQSPAQTATPSEVQGQQAKVQVRTTPAVRLKAPTKPN
uniref:E1A binding protein p400 n=1 Tax=Callorhinchus milii TaxID=7868 RepID=A0A4W3JTD2_CALMI